MTSERCFECNEELTVTCLRCNTRAVPDVPELVTVGYAYMNDDGGLEYAHSTMSEARKTPLVLHSQAVEIIAAKDAEIFFDKALGITYKTLVETLNDECKKRREQAEAAEAKLAQYEAQEPVGCATVYIYKGRRNLVLNELGNNTAGNLPIGEHKLYTSPAPTADLKAGKSDYFMIDDGISYIHPELGEGVFFTDDLLKPALLGNKNHVVTDNVRSLIIAARDVTYSGTISVNSEEYDNLDKALEKFSCDVAWENQP